MERSAESSASLNEIARDTTAAALAHVAKSLKINPAQEDRINDILTAIIRGAVECGILLDRRQRLTPSKN
jgi:hypothetical protein